MNNDECYTFANVIDDVTFVFVFYCTSVLIIFCIALILSTWVFTLKWKYLTVMFYIPHKESKTRLIKRVSELSHNSQKLTISKCHYFKGFSNRALAPSL